MGTAVRDAVSAAMRITGDFRRLSEVEFQKELEWQLHHVPLNNGKIDWRKFRVGQRLFECLCMSQRYVCCHCRAPMDVVPMAPRSSFRPTFEHLIPLSEGGLDHPSNMAIACHHCNKSRGSMDLETFRKNRRLI